MAVTMLDIALKYAEYGFKPFPMVANTKRMYKGSEGYLDGTSDKEQLIKLFNERGIDSNIGLNMVGTHYIVIDIDQHEEQDGFKSLEVLEKKLGRLPATYTVSTTTGNGEHRYYFTNGLSIEKNITGFKEGIDILGTHVNGAPSKVEGTKGYTVKAGKVSEIAELPKAYLDEIVNVYEKSQRSNLDFQVSYRGGSKKWTIASLMEEMVTGIQLGGRNGFTSRIYGSLLRTGMTPAVAIHFIRDWNEKYFEPPLKDAELLAVLKSITKRDNRQKGVKQ